jgi:uncharacterized protein YdeI (YjbR/CyaY-like superfamily)
MHLTQNNPYFCFHSVIMPLNDAPKKEIETFYPTSQAAWRQWLQENHIDKQSIWLIYYKKKSGIPSLSWSEAVDEALCFGWIDSTRKTFDADSSIQYFTKRKPKSVWSKINKAKVDRLMADGLIMQAGLDSIEIAKRNGSWTTLDEAEEVIVPDDLVVALNGKTGASDFFFGLSRSARKAILQWLVLAKLPETRQRRINEIADLASQGLKPKQFR